MQTAQRYRTRLNICVVSGVLISRLPGLKGGRRLTSCNRHDALVFLARAEARRAARAFEGDDAAGAAGWYALCGGGFAYSALFSQR
jgi:hypothetical protein